MSDNSDHTEESGPAPDEAHEGTEQPPEPAEHGEATEQPPGEIDLSEGRKGGISLPAVPIEDVVEDIEALPDAPAPPEAPAEPPPTDTESDPGE